MYAWLYTYLCCVSCVISPFHFYPSESDGATVHSSRFHDYCAFAITAHVQLTHNRIELTKFITHAHTHAARARVSQSESEKCHLPKRNVMLLLLCCVRVLESILSKKKAESEESKDERNKNRIYVWLKQLNIVHGRNEIFGGTNNIEKKRVMDDVRSPSKYEMPVHICIYIYTAEAIRSVSKYSYPFDSN